MAHIKSPGGLLYTLTLCCFGAALVSACTSSPISEPQPESLTAQALTTYFVDNRSGSNCSNSGAGTSSSAPWCDFTPVNARTYGPGDHILLARGASWNQEMQLKGSGAAGNLIELGAYGSGNRPIVTRNGNLGLRAGGILQRAVLLTNPSYWNIHDLEISYAAVGIEAFYDTKGNDTLILDNIYVHHIRGITEANLFYAYDPGKTPICKTSQSNTFDGIYQSAGIVITGPYNLPISSAVSDYVLKNLTVRNIEGTRNLTSVATQFCNVLSDPSGLAASNAIQNARFYNLYLHDDDGGGSPEGCMQSLSLLTTLGAVVYNSIIDKAAGCRAEHGTIAALFSGNKNLTLVNNLFTNTVNTSSFDQGGIDFEYQNDGVKTLSNYFEGNAGPGIEILAIRSSNDFSSNHIIEGNAFKGNGTANVGSYKGAISRIGGSFTPTGVIRDNLYSESAGFLVGDSFSGFSQSNNLAASNGAGLYNSGAGFSAVQGQSAWSYQSFDGSSWSNLSFNSTLNRWQGASGYPFMDRFVSHPNACSNCWVARTFTAPSSGILSIRGRALKAEIGGGDGVLVRITRGANVLLAPQTVGANDQVGVSTQLDSVTVQAGEVIRFEVNARNENSYDWVSWMPSVAYTSYTTPVAGGNLSLTATASASSTDTANGYAASKINDGTASTDFNGWANVYNVALPQWVQLEWGSDQTLSRAEVYTTSGYEIRDFDLQYWNGNAWVTASSVRGNTANQRSLSFSPVVTRKVRILGLSGPEVQPDFIRVNELALYGNTNQAIGATTSASSTDSGNGYAASKVNDGTASTDFNGWANAYLAPLPQWVQLEWPSNKTFGRVELYTTAGYELQDYQVQYWDGTSWQTAVSITGNTLSQRSHVFTPVVSSRLRILGSRGPNVQSDFVRVNEIEVY